MSQAAVENIVKEIQSLSDEDRELLEKHLAEIDEKRWHLEATKAREVAREAGIDQADIDEKIQKPRYEKPPAI